MKKYLLAFILSAIALPLFSAPKGWVEDFGTAQKQSAQQKKNMLVFFTGSDWCGFCRALENNVLTKKEFQSAVRGDYVFVYIDSPKDKSRISEKARTENPKLFKKYAIAGTPTILLMTSDGSVFGRSGYKNVSAKEYAGIINSQTKASVIPNLRIAIKDMPKGEKRARAIDAVLSKFDSDIKRMNMDLVKEICEADPNGKLGMRGKYFEVFEMQPLLDEYSAAMNELVAAHIASRGKSPEEAKKILSPARAKAIPKLQELKKKFTALNATAPAPAKKTIAETLSAINSLLKNS